MALLLRNAHGHRLIEIGGKTVAAVFLLGLLLMAWFVAAATYVAFRDEALQAVALSDKRSVQAYEDRIAELRTRIDKLTARQVANQDTLEDRVASLVARQAEIEARQVMVAEIGHRARESGLVQSAPSGAAETDLLDAVITNATQPTAFAPIPGQRSRPTPLDGIPPLAPSSRSPESTHQADSVRSPEQRGFDQLKMRGAIQGVVDEIEKRTERIERSQILLLQQIAARAEVAAIRDRRVIAATGLPAARFGLREQIAGGPTKADPVFALRDVASDSAMGGPLLPPRPPSLAEAFERGYSVAERQMRAASESRRVMQALPLARPLPSQHDLTSTFGTRVDPFTRSLAMHAGIDFRAPTGTSVRVTAAGRVIEAGTSGGYGRMVEVDHGHGITTRYAHLSVILVKEGDVVPKGAVIGQVGSTGRSTGPHLHYEVRIDDDATDPMRFLRASRGS